MVKPYGIRRGRIKVAVVGAMSGPVASMATGILPVRASEVPEYQCGGIKGDKLTSRNM